MKLDCTWNLVSDFRPQLFPVVSRVVRVEMVDGLVFDLADVTREQRLADAGLRLAQLAMLLDGVRIAEVLAAVGAHPSAINLKID